MLLMCAHFDLALEMDLLKLLYVVLWDLYPDFPPLPAVFYVRELSNSAETVSIKMTFTPHRSTVRDVQLVCADRLDR